MARFDVHQTLAGDFLLECQADILSHLNTRFVVPLLPPETAQKASQLNPEFEIEGRSLIMYTQFASSVRSSELQRFVCSLVDHEFEIGLALNMLISGYKRLGRSPISTSASAYPTVRAFKPLP